MNSRHRRGSLQQGLRAGLTALTLALALAFAVTACSASNSAEPSTAKVPKAEDTGEDVSEKGKKWSGWRWKGDRDNCFYSVGNTCFATEEEACKSAECAEGACQTEAGAPVKVSCRE